MSWYQKEATTHFDTAEIAGLFFLDGDLIARITQQSWTLGMKYPILGFPSEVACEVWGGERDKQDMLVHLFGEMDLPLFGSSEATYQAAQAIAREVGYRVHKQSDTELELVGFDRDEHFIVVYDNMLNQMVDVRAVVHTQLPLPQLLDEESRAKLPKLYHGEESGLGIDAIAPVKFFSPDGGWTWYASEFDGQDMFFGLVIGFEIELGYFTLTELTEVRGVLGLPIERDKFYQPKTLRELQAHHRQERGGR